MRVFLAIDRIADEHNAEDSETAAAARSQARIQMAGREVILAKPETWMNLSGLAVEALVDELDTDLPANLLVVYDELDLPLGKLRFGSVASPAGHNGARSVSGGLGTDEWWRIRIGVGPEQECNRKAFRRGKDYLLTPMGKRDLTAIDPVLDRVARPWRWWWRREFRPP